MPLPFRRLTFLQFEVLLTQVQLRRRITELHLHHSRQPAPGAFAGEATLVGMWRVDTDLRGEPDIAQHLTIDPEGGIWLGRSWNLPPASAEGRNGTAAAGPFMLQLIGDSDGDGPTFSAPQREATVTVCALLLDRFQLSSRALWFEAQLKSPPGQEAGVAAELVAAVEGQLSGEREAPPAALRLEPWATLDTAEPGSEEPYIAGDDEPSAADERGPLPGDAGDVTGGTRPSTPMASSPGEAALPLRNLVDVLRAVEERGVPANAVRGEEGPFGEPPLTTGMKERLRSHVINLSRGQFSSGGEYQTTADDVDALFGEALEEAVAGRTAANPLRLVLWAHGGLVNENSGLRSAYKQVLWWRRNGVYPIYFVWETGFLESIGRLLTGRSGGEEGVVGGVLTEVTDRGIERTARAIHAHQIWGDMKQSAFLASRPEGGGHYAARRLAEFCQRHPGAVELHAVGHSAGAIFHADLLPPAFALGVPAFRSLCLLAPAIRVDRFRERLEPHLGEAGNIRRLAVFTMKRGFELDDNCGPYRKSLLYLIHHALEPEPEAPILGLEISLRGDAALKKLFGLGAPPAGPVPGEVIWSRTDPIAPSTRRSSSVSHGGFGDDADTLDSILRRVLDREEVPVSYHRIQEVLAHVAEGRLPQPAEDLDFIPGDDEGIGFPA